MNHTDCGGYGGREAFPTVEAERQHHIRGLKAARDRLKKKYPHIEVAMSLMNFPEDADPFVETIL